MFYESELDASLRLGDVIKGYVATTPSIETFTATPHADYSVRIQMPTYSVVLTPCCSIRDGSISIAPLVKIDPSLIINPYLSEDMTRLNTKMTPEQAVPPNVWSKMDSEEKIARQSEGMAYAFINLFAYKEHDLFPQYVAKYKKLELPMAHYMVDFKHVYQLSCKQISSPENSLVSSKVLQLTIATRLSLREKLACYYGRPTKEDAAQLA